LVLFMIRLPLGSPLFPYTTLFRSGMCVVVTELGLERSEAVGKTRLEIGTRGRKLDSNRLQELGTRPGPPPDVHGPLKAEEAARRDRKSTRLNSSHLVISYAVFCLK